MTKQKKELAKRIVEREKAYRNLERVGMDRMTADILVKEEMKKEVKG